MHFAIHNALITAAALIHRQVGFNDGGFLDTVYKQIVADAALEQTDLLLVWRSEHFGITAVHQRQAATCAAGERRGNKLARRLKAKQQNAVLASHKRRPDKAVAALEQTDALRIARRKQKSLLAENAAVSRKSGAALEKRPVVAKILRQHRHTSHRSLTARVPATEQAVRVLRKDPNETR
ncbi:hypothetical protein FACS189430_05300 [Bacteroidia bacterium]|nr:hypothetical protein FACS189430_05300 [Bacteroidia bacterium]